MRVLLATSTFLPGIGGAEVAIHNLAEGLVSLGHAVAVCAFQRRSGPEHERGYELFRFSPPRGLGRTSLFSWWHARQIGRVADTWRPDVLHAHFAWPTGHAAVRFRSDGPLPVVLTSHGEDIQIRPEVGYGYRLRPGLDRRIRSAVREADLLTAVGASVRTEYIAMGAEESRVVSIPNGIPWSLLSEENPSARAALELPADRVVLLAVGRNHPKKGFADLVRVMAPLREAHPEALCLIVGRDVPELQPLVDSLDLSGHVRLHGEVPPVAIRFPEVPGAGGRLETFYQAADLYVMSSVVEANPVVLLEAMAAGLPVVARRAPGAEELVREGETGLLADNPDRGLLDALSAILADGELRTRMGRAAREAARRFDRVAVAGRHVEIYERAGEIRRR